MNALIELVPVIMVFSIPLVAIIGGYYVKLQKMKLENGDNSRVSDLQEHMGYLVADNEEIKDRLKNLEYIATDDSNRISLEYEKEQIRLDKQNKS